MTTVTWPPISWIYYKWETRFTGAQWLWFITARKGLLSRKNSNTTVSRAEGWKTLYLHVLVCKKRNPILPHTSMWTVKKAPQHRSGSTHTRILSVYLCQDALNKWCALKEFLILPKRHTHTQDMLKDFCKAQKDWTPILSGTFVRWQFAAEWQPELCCLFALTAGRRATREPPAFKSLHRRFPLRDQVRWGFPPSDFKHSWYSTPHFHYWKKT